jgi:hypothetical protein
MRPTCKFIKENGQRCKGVVLFEDGYCIAHNQTEKAKKARDPEKKRQTRKFGFPYLSFTDQIRKKCLDCSGGSQNEVKFCCIPDCPLWYLRFGCLPNSYINSHQEGIEVLFDKKAFEEGGIFYGADQSAEEAGVILKKHLSESSDG